jgi:dual specificity protein kinase YAK1
MSNRHAFIDFVRGLLNINPLERWSPQQAKLHPFITQQKFTGPFVPPMNLKSSSINRSPAPGTQQQQQAEALSKQRAQAAQAQVHNAQIHSAAQAQAQAQAQYGAGVPPQQYSQVAPQAQPVYNNNTNMYTPNANHQGAPPPYPSQHQAPYNQMGMMSQHPPAQMPPAQYAPGPSQSQQSLYAQAAVRSGRARASTMEVQQGGIPVAIQRVASHLDPNQPIRLQPSPAYYPPPPDGVPDTTPGSARRRGSRAAVAGQPNNNRNNRDFIRNLEDRTLEEGFMGQSQWH